jgi:hypothetical protein
MHIQPTLERSISAIGNHQRIFRFDNGYGASVIQGRYTYGGKAGLFELAVVRLTGDSADDFELTYDTPITDDVIGHLSEDEVQETLAKIRDLPAQSTVPASGEESAR